MAGTKTGDFVELISPFLRRKMTELELAHGMNSAEWRAIALQYVKNPVEAAISPQERRRHYESEIILRPPSQIFDVVSPSALNTIRRFRHIARFARCGPVTAL